MKITQKQLVAGYPSIQVRIPPCAVLELVCDGLLGDSAAAQPDF
jgi:hypothetical protein